MSTASFTSGNAPVRSNPPVRSNAPVRSNPPVRSNAPVHSNAPVQTQSRNVPGKCTALVSIIVPAYNRRELLAQTLQSILEQSYPHIELIVVDDQSTEDLQGIIARFSGDNDRPIQYIRSPQNIGPGGCRELGRQRATGEYVCYVDSDDLLHPDKVLRQVEWMEGAPTASMCYCMSVEFSAWPLRGDERLHSICYETFENFLPIVLTKRPWGTAACLWRRAATDRIGPWTPARGWEDCEYDTRAGCLNLKIIHLPEVLCYYRRDTENARLTANKAQSYKAATESIDSIYRHLLESQRLATPEVASAYAKLCLRFGLRLCRYREKALALHLWNRLVRRGEFPVASRFQAALAIASVRLAGTPLGYKLTRKWLRP